MKSHSNHAAENETPRQQLRKDADACDMPPATFWSFPALSVPASSLQEKIKWTRIKGRDAKLSPLWPLEGEQKAVVYLTSLRDVRKSARRSCTSRGFAAGRRDSRQKKSLEEGRCTGSRIRVRSCPRKVTRNGGRFPKCVNFRKKYYELLERFFF